jgi:ribosomal-protein-alanine N-acetyltransferase
VLADAQALLAFELLNCAWFEGFVDARPADFYSIDGVQQHIQECLTARRLRTMYPALIVDEADEILGRINLRAINVISRTGDLGYRIGFAHAGQGIASEAVARMKLLAQSACHLKRLNAYVAVSNPASMKVLEKNGFKRVGLIPERSHFGGEAHDAYEFVLDLESDAQVRIDTLA